MRWVIAALLGYLATGFIGLIVDDWRSVRRLSAARPMTLLLGTACAVGCAALVFGWGL